MTFVVTESCIRCKYMDCIEVCPADCFYEGETMLVIHPGECIDCGICEPTCPEDAIYPDSYPEAQQFLELNEKYSALWPQALNKKDPLPDAKDFHHTPDKFDRYFSPEPGSG
jgi:ferredoxin